MSAWLNQPALGSTTWGVATRQDKRDREAPPESLLERRLAQPDGGRDCDSCGLPVCACEGSR